MLTSRARTLHVQSAKRVQNCFYKTTIRLTTNSGDADLYIFLGDDLESSELLCKSTNTPDESTVDSCLIEATSASVFAVVFGFADSTYSVSGESELLVSDSNGSGITGGSSGSQGSGAVGWCSLVFMVLVTIRRLRMRVIVARVRLKKARALSGKCSIGV